MAGLKSENPAGLNRNPQPCESTSLAAAFPLVTAADFLITHQNADLS
jgi:hypothetical protein